MKRFAWVLLGWGAAACAPAVESKGADVAAVDEVDSGAGGDTAADDGGSTSGDDGGADGDTAGGDGTEDGGSEDGGSEDGGTEDGGSEDGGTDDGSDSGGDGDDGGGETGDDPARCSIVIPADATVYTGNASSNVVGEWAVVCGSGTASFSGAGASVAVFSGAGAVIGGDSSEVWLEGSADLANLADGTIIHTTDGSRVVDNGTNTTLDICDEVTIDASAVDLSGC